MTLTAEASIPQLIELPKDGYSLFYREDTHAYQVVNPKGKPGVRMPGASTVAKAFPDRPDGLMRWTETTTLEGIARLYDAEVALSSDPYLLREVLGRHNLRYEQARSDAATRGQNIHRDVLEALARGESIPDLADLPEDQRGYGQAVFRWWSARNPRPLNVEQIIYSRIHGYAGRFDLRAVFDDPFTSTQTEIWDLKTSKRPYPSDHIQLRLYDIAARECGIGGSEALGILQVKPDGTYVEHQCAASEEHALLAVQAYKARKEVDNAMKAA